MARIKKAQAGADTSKKTYSASFTRVIGDSAAMRKKITEDSTARKKKVDSLGLSTSRAQDLLKARIAAKKQRSGGKIKPKASNVSKKLGSAKKSIGNIRFAKKKK